MSESQRPGWEELRLDEATGDSARGEADLTAAASEAERAAAAAHAAMMPTRAMPVALRETLAVRGSRLVAGGGGGGTAGQGARQGGGPQRGTGGRAGWIGPWLIAAAGVALAAGVGGAAWRALGQRQTELDGVRVQLAAMEARAASNERLLADARAVSERLRVELEGQGTALDAQELALARAEARNLELAERLATASTDLDSALRRLARHEAPMDPAVLADRREKLLEVPGSVRVAWQPFDLPDAPAMQRGSVEGDVVWNDELEEGYLRFVGLRPNDPSVEQYQVWVIDERGMEQKVSGGVFDATADGELIVPIDPGIAVGRVAVFAVTVEEPGGIWVPDLSRRVVVAPRGG